MKFSGLVEQQNQEKYDHRGKTFSTAFFNPIFFTFRPSFWLFSPPPSAPADSHRINQQKKGKRGGGGRKQLRLFRKSPRIRHLVEQDLRGRKGLVALVLAGRGRFPLVKGQVMTRTTVSLYTLSTAATRTSDNGVMKMPKGQRGNS